MYPCNIYRGYLTRNLEQVLITYIIAFKAKGWEFQFES